MSVSKADDSKDEAMCGQLKPTNNTPGAARARPNQRRREDLRIGMVEPTQVLDGSLKSDVMLLTGLTAAEIDAVGGIDE